MQSETRDQMLLHPCADLHWHLKSIPAELTTLKQWVPCYHLNPDATPPVKTAKRPMGGPTLASNKNVKTLVKVFMELDRTTHQHFGLILSASDPYVILDVDDLPLYFTFEMLPPTIQNILTLLPTYVELSPSGQGLHIIYRTNKTDLASAFGDQAKYENMDCKGTFYVRDQFLTFTGHTFIVPGKDFSTIAEVAPLVLGRLALTEKKTLADMFSDPAMTVQAHMVPDYTIQDIESMLMLIPPSLTQSPLCHAFTKTYARLENPLVNPSDYEHWRTIAAAVHAAAAAIDHVAEGADLFATWSASDKVNFESPEAARKKYYENPPKDSGITVQTLRKLSNSTAPRWRATKTIIRRGADKTEHIPTNEPILTNLHNWEQLIYDIYGLSFARNEVTKKYRVQGPTFILDKYFAGTLNEHAEPMDIAIPLLKLAQDKYFKSSTIQHATTGVQMVLQNLHSYNPMKEAIDAERPFDPQKEGSPFDRLWDTLTLREDCRDPKTEALFKSYLKKSLMGVIRAHYYTGPYGGTTGIVILTGPESAYKSTWVKQLLPPALRAEYFGTSTVALKQDMKELQLQAGRYQILLFDEIERIMSRNSLQSQSVTDSLFKNFLVQESDCYRPVFGKVDVQAPRKCIFLGTTNERNLAISDNGSRRIQIIHTEFCNTAAQAKINIMRVYKELLYIFNKTPKSEQPALWNLSSGERSDTNMVNSTRNKAVGEVETVIRDLYRWEEAFDPTSLLTERGSIRLADQAKAGRMILTKDILNDLRVNGIINPALGVVNKTLQRMCSLYTNTINSPLLIANGQIEQGRYRTTKGNQSKWVMPRPVNPFDDHEPELDELD